MFKKPALNRVIYIMIVILVILATRIYTIKTYDSDYRVKFRCCQHEMQVTDFHVTAEEDQLMTMFDESLLVDVTIKGTVDGPLSIIDCVQKSERVEKIDGKEVMVICFEPHCTTNLNPFKVHPDNMFEETFSYEVAGYDEGNLEYVFRCGDFEETLYAKRKK